MEKLRVGIIGLGCRGYSLMQDVILRMQDVEVTAVCDEYKDRVQAASKLAEEAGGKLPLAAVDVQEVLDSPLVDAVVIASAWESHIPIAVRAMHAGKAVGMEVGGAYSVKQCWDLVDAWEATKAPFMLLENCCYGRREMMAMNMVKKEYSGRCIHCKGGYLHDLREEIAGGKENRHYRLRNYIHRNAENYPTHELGPIAQILNINRGNRMLTLTSTVSKAEGLREYLSDSTSAFAQGDVVNTVIKCAGGETILLTLNTTLPRFYSRDFTVWGTKGMYEEATDSVFLDKIDAAYDFKWKEKWGNAAEYEKDYEHPTWKKFLAEGIKGSHDGMDWLEFEAFFDSVRNHRPCPIDVYDAAAWMSVTALAEESIALGGHPVAIPDFTNGKWILAGENREYA
ncbi:Gfo/Idh/MocA family oxidoreductase [Blautia sp. RD014234]|nr:Gfo/Idh/MocA family oxidoreductase [Blautia parvula]